MVDIQFAAAEIRRGKKGKKKDRNHRAKIFHRATIITIITSASIF